ETPGITGSGVRGGRSSLHGNEQDHVAEGREPRSRVENPSEGAGDDRAGGGRARSTAGGSRSQRPAAADRSGQSPQPGRRESSGIVGRRAQHAKAVFFE